MNNLPVLVVVFRVSTSKFYCRAPKEWLKAMHGERAEWGEQPNYAVLVDTRDRPAPQLTYVPQENIEVYTVVERRCRGGDFVIRRLHLQFPPLT